MVRRSVDCWIAACHANTVGWHINLSIGGQGLAGLASQQPRSLIFMADVVLVDEPSRCPGQSGREVRDRSTLTHAYVPEGSGMVHY